jgi:hypothetical protein
MQIVLYITFLALDLAGGSIRFSVGIKYTIIILCFCYALLTGGANKSCFFTHRKLWSKTQSSLLHLLQAGLFFTLISDLFILVLDFYFYGVCTFILVQQLYSLRLIILQQEQQDDTTVNNRIGRKLPLFRLFVRRFILQAGIAIVICLLVMMVGVTLDRLLIVSVFYFICILSNTITAICVALLDRRDRSNRLYAVGMMLFLLCDINVGLFNLTGFISMPKDIYNVIYSFSSILMWTFYAPSQVLIAMSSRYINKK